MYIFAWLAHHLASLRSLPRRRRSDGGSAVEYSLLVALIGAIIVAAVATLGTMVLSNFNQAGTGWPN
jgi:Flp pilus assembly pilin Flp